MIFYLIGPSNVGKTFLAQEVAKLLDCIIHKHLDKLIKEREGVESLCEYFTKVGPSGFWEKSRELIHKIKLTYEDTPNICLIDVGAGVLESPKGRDFLKKESERTIVVLDYIEKITRRDHLKRSFKEYCQKELKYERIKVYKQAKYKFLIGGFSKEEAVKAFIKFLTIKILGEYK